MRYIPHTEHDIQAMLAVLGVDSVEDLIRHLPEDLRQNASLDIAPGLAESEITQRLTTFAELQGSAPARSGLFLEPEPMRTSFLSWLTRSYSGRSLRRPIRRISPR